MKFITWVKEFFEDQTGGASRKAVVLYWSMGILTYQVVKSTNGAQTNMEMFWGFLGLVLAGLGMVTAEYFKKTQNTINKELTN